MGGNIVRLLAFGGILLCPSMTSVVRAQLLVRAEEHTMPAVVTIDVQEVPLKTALQAIAKQAKLRLAISNDVMPQARLVTLRVTNVSPSEAFNQVLAGTDVRATIITGTVVLERVTDSGVMMAQGSVAGQVVDAKTKQPLRGVAMTLSGLSTVVTTGDEGRFRFPSVASGAHTLTGRRLGYVKATKTVTVVDGQTTSVDLVLELSVSALDQVVVTGTIVATAQRAVPNAMTVITAKDIEERGITRIQQLFRGDVPGLFMQEIGSANPLDSVTMFSRGATALQSSTALNAPAATNPIKTYVDGVELADPKYLSQIDPRSIERIEILTGPQASTIYGSNAINGVMQIFTKHGHAGHPQMTSTLTTGVVQSNFSDGLAPMHAGDVFLAGMEARWSYNVGGAWDYMGAWTPSKQTTKLSGFGGVRADLGRVTVDARLRQNQTQNRARGSEDQIAVAEIGNGMWTRSVFAGHSAPTTAMLSGQTMGLTVHYAPVSWWSHEIVVGRDMLTRETKKISPAFMAPVGADSMRSFNTAQVTRPSQRYMTTLQGRVWPEMHATLTAGGDWWSNTEVTLNTFSTPALVGTLPGVTVVRNTGRNAGMFVQGQVALWDALFFTSGIRWEWNPNYGDEAQPNVAPRYGVAFTRDVGLLTAKLRASYGRSTRPPTNDQKGTLAQTLSNAIQTYGPYNWQVENPGLGPEYQQGGEGGLELYLGNRGSLIVTRYNQTVDALIAGIRVDSVQSLVAGTSGDYTYASVVRNLNVGSVRNQGWELQGTATVGALNARGTYSWTKSRVIGITPKYRSLLTGRTFAPGYSFRFLPEHTWGLGLTHTRAAGTTALQVNGTGALYLVSDDLWYDILRSRLSTDRPRSELPNLYQSMGRGYATADLHVTQRVFSMVEMILDVQNIADFYRNDVDKKYATMGRQTRVGVRMRTP